MGDTTDIIVLRLTREEAFALDDLADTAMDRLASNRKVLAHYAQTGANLRITASACDKLRRTVADEPDSIRWTNLIQQVPDKSRTLLGDHDGLSTEAAFERFVLEAERKPVARRHNPDVVIGQSGRQIRGDLIYGDE